MIQKIGFEFGLRRTRWWRRRFSSDRSRRNNSRACWWYYVYLRMKLTRSSRKTGDRRVWFALCTLHLHRIKDDES